MICLITAMDFHLRTTNIKFSVQVGHFPQARRILQQHHKKKLGGNFFVLQRRFIFIIFFGGHINITGVRHFQDIKKAVQELRLILKLNQHTILEYTIDNVCSAGQTPFHLILLQPLCLLLHHHLERWCMYREFVLTVHYQPEKFPSLHIKTKIGSILLFGTGKFIFVGYKRQADAQYLLDLLQHVLGRRRKENHGHVFSLDYLHEPSMRS